MVEFVTTQGKCVSCGKCVADCPQAIITLENGQATIGEEDREDCIACQHCLTICPTGAVFLNGLRPENSLPVTALDPRSLERLIRGRRSVRQFSPEPVDGPLLERVLDTVSHAPTGTNSRQRRFTLVLDPERLAEYRDRCCRALVSAGDRLPEDLSWLASAASKWLEKERDVIFRRAPHLIVVTSGPDASTPEADCLIALSYFDLVAQANGIGTVWCGMVDFMLRALPETAAWLGIPPDHRIGYAMLFGRPSVRYMRTAQYEPEDVAVVERLAE